RVLPRRRAALLLGVRLAGPRDVGDPHAGDLRRGARQGDRDVLAAPEGGGRQRQARPRARPPPADPRGLRGLALGYVPQPGTRCRVRDRALPLVVAALGGLDRVAAQRLLARDELG